MKAKFLRGCLNKLKKTRNGMKPCRSLALWCCNCIHERKSMKIPKDVPKGHLVVYVGENYKRFVIKVALLNHPLFKALLDQAKEEYDFIADSKLCIPCKEHIFLTVLTCASSSLKEHMFVCF